MTTEANHSDARRDRSPLDSYVEQVLRLVEASASGVPTVGLPAAIAQELEWPVPFAEAVLASVKARRLLRVNRMGARSIKLTLSQRGASWLDERARSI